MGWKFTMSREHMSRNYSLNLELLGNDDEHPIPCDCGSVKCEIVKHYIGTVPPDIAK